MSMTDDPKGKPYVYRSHRHARDRPTHVGATITFENNELAQHARRIVLFMDRVKYFQATPNAPKLCIS